jgi:uncharacterized protein YfaS (alpha-2-macroglobulin family)
MVYGETDCFRQGETLVVSITTKDIDTDTATDVDNVYFKLIDDSGTSVMDYVECTRTGTGTYRGTYTIDSNQTEGTYKVYVKISDATDGIDYEEFEILINTGY